MSVNSWILHDNHMVLMINDVHILYCSQQPQWCNGAFLYILLNEENILTPEVSYFISMARHSTVHAHAILTYYRDGLCHLCQI